MKNLLIYISLLIAATTLGFSLAPVTVVLNNDGDNLTAQLNDYSSGEAVGVGEIGTITVPTVTPNGSGYSSFVIGEGEEEWENFSSDDVNSNMLVDIFDDGDLVGQFKLTELQEVTARLERLPAKVKIGRELRVEGEMNVDSTATFEQKVEVKGVFVQASNEFSDAEELGDITTNIMIYVGGTDYNSYLEIEEEDFSDDLQNGATYTIVHNGEGELAIDLDNGYASIYKNQTVTLIKIDDVLYIVSQPGFQGE